ncbi:hypothetical protein C8J57DRAFT_1533041 [Mycena rebaudengoi]|nr:hypothetical protein C8J57DRAFT_1533041 [Mycena rebaudengoi]
MKTPLNIPLDIVGEIASYAPRPTLLRLFLVSHASRLMVRRFLYQHIVVRNQKHRALVRTLSSDGVLPPLVRTLEFQWTEYCGRVWGPAWDDVLIGMTNLKELTIADHVQLSNTARQGITFSLIHFSTSAAILGNWSLLLQNQPTIELLEVAVTLAGPTPVLPNLKRAILTPSVAAKLLEVNTISDIIFYPTFLHNVRTISQGDLRLFARAQPGLVTLRLRCKQFLNLLSAPNIFAQLKHLVLDDDKTWRSDPLVDFEPTCCIVSPVFRARPSLIHLAHGFVGHKTLILEDSPSPSMNPALARALEPGATRVRRKNPAAGEDRLWPLADWLTEIPVWSPLPSRYRPQSQDDIGAVETTPYTRMGPETPIEKEWRVSMQGVADLAEEWVAEGEAKWQADYQLLADWSR